MLSPPVDLEPLVARVPGSHPLNNRVLILAALDPGGARVGRKDTHADATEVTAVESWRPDR